MKASRKRGFFVSAIPAAGPPLVAARSESDEPMLGRDRRRCHLPEGAQDLPDGVAHRSPDLRSQVAISSSQPLEK
jgi:hypothetical protein